MKEINHPKADYLELLLENDDGLTVSEIVDIFFDDVTEAQVRMALRRLYKQSCASREKEDGEYRYWITDVGIQKYDYLMNKI